MRAARQCVRAVAAATTALLGCAGLAAAPQPVAETASSRVSVAHRPVGGHSIEAVTRSCRSGPPAGRAERVVALANIAWERFGREEQAEISEGPDPRAGAATDAEIAGFWTSIPTNAAAGYFAELWANWRENPQLAREQPWSAAFTSWLMCEAGFSDAEFARSFRHRAYVAYAMSAPAAAHRVFYHADAAPERGDILCANKTADAPRFAKADQLPSRLHCFLVVEASGGELRAIGGNVSGRVVMIRSSLQGTGAAARVVRSERTRWILLMKLRERD